MIFLKEDLVVDDIIQKTTTLTKDFTNFISTGDHFLNYKLPNFNTSSPDFKGFLDSGEPNSYQKDVEYLCELEADVNFQGKYPTVNQIIDEVLWNICHPDERVFKYGKIIALLLVHEYQKELCDFVNSIGFYATIPQQDMEELRHDEIFLHNLSACIKIDTQDWNDFIYIAGSYGEDHNLIPPQEQLEEYTAKQVRECLERMNYHPENKHEDNGNKNAEGSHK